MEKNIETGRKSFPVRVVRYEIGPEEAGWTVREYLNRKIRLSHHQISSLKYRPDGIVLNGQTVRVTCVLQAGDLLQIGLKDAGNAYLVPGDFTEPPEILFENADLLVVNKPAGMVCHPSPGHYADSLANQVAAYARSRQEDWTIRLIGRLDADTSGAQVFAKNSETAALLSRQRAEGKMEKTYLALCEGVIPAEEGEVDLHIGNDPDQRGRMRVSPEGKTALTRYKVLRRDAGRTLVRVQIEHGRTHQIRVHLAAAGYPLVGDPFYGNGERGRDHAALHAWRLRMSEPFSGEELLLEAPAPAWADCCRSPGDL